MRIDGLWHLCADGVIRPVLEGEIEAGDGSWVKALFLLDTGADATVFSSNVLGTLHLPTTPHSSAVGGVGGSAAAVTLVTRLRFRREDGTFVYFRGLYAALTAPDALDMSVLGRDITDLFALIVDRPGDVVCLIRPPHQYTIRVEATAARRPDDESGLEIVEGFWPGSGTLISDLRGGKCRAARR